jgi:hypothetical protein
MIVVCGAALVVALALIQLVPVTRSNPPVTSDLDAPPGVKKILRASCYDCHSNETRWPWYSRVAPVSWLVAHDVEEGRSRFNFSEWSAYEPKRRKRLAAEMWKEVEAGEMPLPVYLLAHPGARLSEAHRAALEAWTAEVSGKR